MFVLQSVGLIGPPGVSQTKGVWRMPERIGPLTEWSTIRSFAVVWPGSDRRDRSAAGEVEQRAALALVAGGRRLKLEVTSVAVDRHLQPRPGRRKGGTVAWTRLLPPLAMSGREETTSSSTSPAAEAWPGTENEESGNDHEHAG